MDCSKCNTKCCERMFFRLENRDHALWAFYHGLDVFKVKGKDEYKAKINIPCQQLKDGKCLLHGQVERPQMCEDYWCDLTPELTQIFI